MSPEGARFSTEYKRQFQELLAQGIELHAINQHPERLPFGPWSIACDRGDGDTRTHLKARFRVHARKAAIEAGAPRRAHVLNWWVSQLAKGQRLPYIQGLIRRSIDYCEDLESNAAELKPIVGGERPVVGLNRDRYPCERPVAFWLYDESHEPFPNALDEFEYWKKHIWDGFEEAIAELVRTPRKRRRWADDSGNQICEPKEETRRRLGARIEQRTELLDAWILGLSYDLAVLLANRIVDLDLGLPVDDAMRGFDSASAILVGEVRQAWQRRARTWGLSWRKQEKRCIDLTKPFKDVAADLRHLLATHSPRTPVAPEAAHPRPLTISLAGGGKPSDFAAGTPGLHTSDTARQQIDFLQEAFPSAGGDEVGQAVQINPATDGQDSEAKSNDRGKGKRAGQGAPKMPRRSPDLAISRARIELVEVLSRELATVRPELRQGYRQAAELKQRYPNLALWTELNEQDLKELLNGERFLPKAYAENLVLRKYALTSRETLKKDRQKLRRADRAKGTR